MANCRLGSISPAKSSSGPSCSTQMENETLTGTIIGRAMYVHNALGPGFVESVYHNALTHALRGRGVVVELGKRVQVHFDGVVVGEFAPDMLVDGVVLVEIKAIRAIAPAHEIQLVNYLTATKLDIGLLLNFGGERLEFKRKTRGYRAPRVTSQMDNEAVRMDRTTA